MNDIAFDIYTSDGIYSGQARSWDSVQWLEPYRGVGEIKMTCAATPNNLNLLQPGRYIHNTDRPAELAEILYTVIEDDTAQATLTVRGKMLVHQLADRVLMHTATIGAAEAGMLDMVKSNLRGLPLAVSAPSGIAARYDGQISWGSVLDGVDKVATRCGLGYRVTVDARLHPVFAVYQGKDRTDPAGPHWIGCFGDDAGNLASVQIKSDTSTLANLAVVAGAGSGSDRAVELVDLSDGQPRREIYVDAKDLQRTYTVQNADGSVTEKTLSEPEYRAQLRGRGLQALTEHAKGVQLSAELRQSMLLLGRDYDLGDILPVSVARYGLKLLVRVVALNIVYEDSKKIMAKLEVVT